MVVFIVNLLSFKVLIIMANDSSSGENVGNPRWYCHVCEDETETLTEVTDCGSSYVRTNGEL